ncbi:Nn.00g090140.m01.CDS01 [Neocucurbitaria sp. VM-36]
MASTSSSSSTPSPTPSNSTQQPVTRIACFRFHPNVTAAQKAGRTSAFLDLYAQHQELILGMPRGGRPLNTPLDLTNVKREKEWDTGFIVVFKDDAARKEFDADKGHDRLKSETDVLLEQVFVYDFVEQANLGW